MPDFRAIVTISVPAVAALLGLLWLFGRKKPPVQKKNADPPDKVKTSSQSDKSEKSPPLLEQETITATSVVDPPCSGQKNDSQSNIDSKLSTDITSALLPSIQTDQSNQNHILKQTNDKVSSSTSVAAVGKHAQSTMEGETIAEIKTTAVDSAPQIDASGDHPNEPDTVVEEIVEAPSVVPHCTSSPSNNLMSHSHSSPQTIASTSSELNIDEQIIAPVTVENIQSLPVQSHEISDSPQNKETESDRDNVLIESMSSTNDTSIHIQLDTNINSKCDEDNSDLKNESSQSMSRSWHEEVDENCDFGDVGVTLPTYNVVNTDLKDTKPGAAVVENGCSADKSVKNDKKLTLRKTPSGSPRASSSRDTNSVDRHDNKQKEEMQNSSESSSNCDNSSEASNDSGKGGSVNDSASQSVNDEERVYEFNIPSDICGLFIGGRGKTVKQIRDQSGARIRLRNNPYTPDFQICVIEGPQSAIEKACNIIRRKFPSIKYPGMDPMTPISNPVIVPEIMQMNLPEGVSVDVVVSSIVDAGRLFIQQPTHPTFPSLERLNTFMNQCYVQEGSVPDVPRPIENGVICAAPMLNGWYRAQIMAYYDNTDECDIKYVDYGGYSRISSSCLKQIRSDFMTLPFEAVECYLANITPLEGENYFSTEAAVILEELTQGKLLQAQVVGRAEDGIPYVHVYQINGVGTSSFVNRELVNRGVVRWMELLS